MKKPPYEELEKELIELKKIHTQSVQDRNEFNSEKKHLLSEEILEDLFRLSPSLMVIRNPEGKIFKINNSCETILGYTEKELLKIGLWSLIHPDDVEKTSQARESGLKGNPIPNFTNRYKNKNGLYRTLEWQAIMVKDGFTYAYGNDITEQNEALVELLFLSDEKEKRADELILANKELLIQNEQKKIRANELIIANKELSYQNDKKHKRADELVLANRELHFQNEQRKKRADELILANKEMEHQKDEKGKRAAELKIAKIELEHQQDEKAKLAVELKIANIEIECQQDEKAKLVVEQKIANIELEHQQDEKGKRADELIIANIELEHQQDENERRTDELKIANVEQETQIHIQEKLKNALITVHVEMDLQNEAIKKRADELKIANIELEHQQDLKEKRADELIVANIELEHQQDLKEKRADQLIEANIELERQQDLKEKRADELIVANIELEHQEDLKEKRAVELVSANKELKQQSKEIVKSAEELFIAYVDIEKQNEEKLKRADELVIANIELEYQNKEKGKRAEELKDLNATKDKLFSIIAHDLRSPFNGILGFSEMLMDNLEDYDVAESEVYLGIINSSAKSTLALLDNLLDWANYQTGQINFKPEKIKFSTIVQEVFDVSILAARMKNITLKYIKSKEVEVYADLNMLKTILRNLISNSIKFTNPKGNIEIKTIQKQNFVEITVSDNGVGIDAETLKDLFVLNTNDTKLGTAKESGSGLGLVLCKEFAEKQGGEIRVESELGKGSTFKLTLPIGS